MTERTVSSYIERLRTNMQKTIRESLADKINYLKEFWQTKKNQHLTIMLVPHSEKKTHKIYISYSSILIFLLLSVGIIFISTVNILNHNFKQYEIKELNLSNQDFVLQSEKLKKEVENLQKLIEYYDSKIQKLYSRLGGNSPELLNQLNSEQKELLKNFEKETNIAREFYTQKASLHDIKLSTHLVDEMIYLIKKKNNLVKNTPYLWPAKGYILFPFGKYVSPITGKLVKNNGIDIGAFPGTEVIATAPGTVFETGFTENTGYYIKIAHRFGWKTIYANMDRIQVEKDQVVSREDVIGFVGKSSISKFYFLHYEIHVGTNPLNPSSFLNQIEN